MNQKQKALAEKAIKLRYNGLIGGVDDAAREAMTSLPNHVTVPSYGGRSLEGDMPLNVRKAGVALTGKWKALAKASWVYEKAADQYNDKLAKDQDALRQRRDKVIAQLRARRDEAIIAVHFGDAEGDMKVFLDELIGVSDVRKMLEDARLPSDKISLPTGLGAVQGMLE